MTKEQLSALLLQYASNDATSLNVAECIGVDEAIISDTMRLFLQDWEAVECDAEGCTKEQDAELDNILDEYVAKLLALKETIFRSTMSQLGKKSWQSRKGQNMSELLKKRWEKK